MKTCKRMLCVGLSCLCLAAKTQNSQKPLVIPLEFNDFDTKDAFWCVPGVAALPDGTWLATMQANLGSDYGGNPLFSFSKDRGVTWTPPTEIESCKMTFFKDTPYRVAMGDIRPFVSPNDGTAFVFGCTCYYSPKGNVSWEKGDKPDFPPEQALYVTWRPDTGWSKQKVLPLPPHKGNYRTAATQLVFVENNEVLIPIYLGVKKTIFGGFDHDRYAVVVARYRQVGEELEFISTTPYMELDVERGLCEPSIIRLPEGGFALTIRAEDRHGYVCCSADGDTWSERMAWRWEDGTPLTMSSTQQHWVLVGGKVYLVYTRDDGSNTTIFRYRAPLYIAEAIPSKAVLLRSTEQVLFHRLLNNGEEAHYGNFHCTQLSSDTALVTDTAEWPKSSRIMAAIIAP